MSQGPDHPQYEAYSTSKHGWMYEKSGAFPHATAPSCSTCHFRQKAPDGHTIHDSLETVAWNYKPGSKEFQRGRETMLNACTLCHSRARAHLEVADQTGKRVASGLVQEAQKLLDEMYEEGLIKPPLAGTEARQRFHRRIAGPQKQLEKENEAKESE